MERVPEPRLLSFFSGQSFYGLQVEVVVEVQVVQVLPMNQQVQHVVALAADLRSSRVRNCRGSLKTLSRGRVDGVNVTSRRIDAIAAILKVQVDF